MKNEMNTLPNPRSFADQLEAATTFCHSISDGGNIGGDVNDNDDYIVYIDFNEDDNEYRVSVICNDEDNEDFYFNEYVNSVEEVIEALQELEQLVPQI